jgi:hypothetical protein
LTLLSSAVSKAQVKWTRSQTFIGAERTNFPKVLGRRKDQLFLRLLGHA